MNETVIALAVVVVLTVLLALPVIATAKELHDATKE